MAVTKAVVIPQEYVPRSRGTLVMTDKGTSRIECFASCVVDDDHNVHIDRQALVRMLYGGLPWLRCCGEPVIVISRGVPVDEVQA